MWCMKRGLKAAGLLLLILTLPSLAQEKPSVIPYQGQLADQEGKPINPPKAMTLVFRIYWEPVGGTPTWQEAHHNVSVVGGRFSVLLGAREPFPNLRMFNQTVYLGVTVDDEDPVTADVEMRPRQAIVPVIAAVHATEADQAKEADYAKEAEISFHAINSDGAIPVGGITLYFGLQRDLPDNWKICNGQLVKDMDSRFRGQTLPDLRNLFVRGAVDDLAVASTEGIDRVPLRRVIAHTVGEESWAWGAANVDLGDNRPRHIALHYIIRIR